MAPRECVTELLEIHGSMTYSELYDLIDIDTETLSILLDDLLLTQTIVINESGEYMKLYNKQYMLRDYRSHQ